jgi:sugar transferase (PEP-CTERM/EpsH1 system associated)
MKLLFLTPQLPYPPRQGTTLRNFNLIRCLAQTHTIDLFTLLAPGEALAEDSPLRKLCGRIVTAPQPVRSTRVRAVDTLRSHLPDMALRLADPAAGRAVDGMIRAGNYDVVQAEGIEMARYALRAKRLGKDAPRIVFDNHNAEYLLQKRAALVDLRYPKRWAAALYSLVQWQKLRRFEERVCRAADAVVVVSGPDQEALRRLHPSIDAVVAPNGVDLNGYTPQPLGADPAQPVLVFTGKMDYRPNVDAVLWFVGQVLPLIQVAVPAVHLQVVGMNPHARLDVLHSHPAVTLTGAVDDPRPFVRDAAVYVVPMRVGGGTRFKVLEAMAAGKAIVSTSLGVEGIGVAHEREMLIANRPTDFAAQVVRLLRDQRDGGPLSRGLGNAAYAFVEREYTWQHIIPRLEAIYQQFKK